MGKLKVLVVDDEPGIRSGISRILRNFTVGYPFMEDDFSFEIIEAETGEQALEIINSNKPDIVLLDNKLPGIHGIEVLQHINKNHIDVEVMMITSYASLELAVKATGNGAFNFVPKPFTPQELKSSMESITKHLFLKRMTSKMKEESKQLKFQFLSVLSHELKSPINAIEGYLKIMSDRQVGENIKDYQTMIDRSMTRINGMRNLIMDMLDLTKIESGKKKRELKNTDLNEIAKLAISSIEPLAIQRNISIHLHSDENTFYQSDCDEMEIIFNNLLSNAVKYNLENGEVNISIMKQKKEIKIKVEDTGIGMTEEDVSKLFHDFVRIKNSKTKNITGSGLGLSITKDIVELYGGKIDVNSIPDKGTTFTIMLPSEHSEKPSDD
ncbi:MAG: response regulator [Bacteroidales bacterium]|nr:response regulator [Bacteroidales bacterium]